SARADDLAVHCGMHRCTHRHSDVDAIMRSSKFGIIVRVLVARRDWTFDGSAAGLARIAIGGWELIRTGPGLKIDVIGDVTIARLDVGAEIDARAVRSIADGDEITAGGKNHDVITVRVSVFCDPTFVAIPTNMHRDADHRSAVR